MPPLPTPENNIASVRSGIEEVWNGSWDAAAKYYHPDILVSAPPQTGRLDLDGFKELHAMLHAAFPDFRMSVDRIFGEDDRVVARWTARGTHGGPFMGCPASGRRFEVMEAGVFRLEHGKAKEVWFIRNGLGQMQQLGLMPKGPPPKALLAVIRAVERLGALMPARRKG